MGNSGKLDDCKKEIRSILIPYQKGIYLSQFHKAYRDLIGRRLPVSEFGFNTDTEFLYSMPDVVKMTPTRSGEYHLLAIADEKSKHILKMVAKQKPAKLKPPPPRFYQRVFDMPPRFSEIRKVPESNMPQRTLRKEPVLPPNLPQRTLRKEPVLPPNLPQGTLRKEPVSPNLPEKTFHKDPVLPPKETSRNDMESNKKLTLQDEVILLVQNCNNKVALDDFHVEYRRMYNKRFSLSQYDISSLEECIELIPELKLTRRNSVDFIVHCSDLAQTTDIEIKNSYLTSDNHTSRSSTPKMTSNYNAIQNQSYYEGNIPMSLRQKFLKVAEKYPGEILASDFPDCFEKVTSEPLDFQGLGYRCLNDLIDDVPDIFNRKPVAGSRKDYIIYSAKSEVDSSSLFVDHIVLNFRKILQAYPEGIKMKDILNVYNINYKDTLHIEDLGFTDLEAFLSSIKNSVPLKFDLINGQKSVHLKLNYTPLNLNTQPESNINQKLPFDAVSPNFIYKPLVLPDDFDYSEFKPVYVSAVAHPGHLYIQFQSGNMAKKFVEMSKNLEQFYEDKQSDSYMMKSIHIKEGASCVSKWPADQHWYRAQLLSPPSNDKVKVFYVDYGTTDTIPTNLLRYSKKEYVDIPAQAIKCRLSFLKPAHNAQKWDPRAKDQILSMCHDIPLMAKFEKGSDGIYSLVLCDTNGEEDVYINDVLREKGFAEYDLDEPTEPTKNDPVPPEPPKIQLENQHNLNALQALQAQFYLKAFAAIAPSFSQNENYLSLLRQVSVYCQTPDTLQQNISAPFMPSAGPPGFDSFPRNINPSANLSTLYNTFPTGATTIEGNLVKGTANVSSPLVSTTDHFIKAPVQTEPFTFPKLIENSVVGIEDCDNDIFDEDDDETFQQFCQKVSSTKLRYVKKAHLGDGYKLHIIIVESTPYASSGDISHLIWNNKEADYMYQRLQLKDTDISAISLSEDGNEELFQQLNRFDVKGVQNTTGFKSSILLYPLKNVIRILNIFGHPSMTLRRRLTEEMANFNPEDSYWQEFSHEATESDDDNGFTGATDDDKIERLCLFDLMAMKESILCRKKKMMHLPDLENHRDEFHKLNQLLKKVLERIREIKEICKQFE